MCLVTPERAYYGQFCFCCCRSFDNVKLYIKQRAGLGRAAPVKMLVCWTITRPARRPPPAAALLLSQSELLRCHWHSYFRLQWYYHDHHILWPHKRWKRTHFTPENCQSVRWVSFQERSAQGDKVEFWQVSDTRQYTGPHVFVLYSVMYVHMTAEQLGDRWRNEVAKCLEWFPCHPLLQTVSKI